MHIRHRARIPNADILIKARGALEHITHILLLRSIPLADVLVETVSIMTSPLSHLLLENKKTKHCTKIYGGGISGVSAVLNSHVQSVHAQGQPHFIFIR